MSTDNFSKVLVIVPCGKRKIWEKHPSINVVRAKDAYISNYFRLCRSYAERFAGQWFILSGKHGIIEPDSLLSSGYNVRLNASNAFEGKVKEQLRHIVSKGFTEIVSLCGKEYSDFLNSVLASFDLVVQMPLRGLRIGERQRQLKKCLKLNQPL
jgi:hypothetical protein